MTPLMEWMFTANLHPYQIIFGMVLVGLLYEFLESCYGKLRRRP